jgi:hypothetical protein
MTATATATGVTRAHDEAFTYLNSLYGGTGPHGRKQLRRKLEAGGYLRPLVVAVLVKRYGVGEAALDAWVAERLTKT